MKPCGEKKRGGGEKVADHKHSEKKKEKASRLSIERSSVKKTHP